MSELLQWIATHWQLGALLAILVFTMAAFVREWMPIDLVAFTCLGLLLAFRLVTPEEAISGFSNPAVITVMMMFILSAALVKSGVVRRIGYKLVGMAGRSGRVAGVALLNITGVLSGFINNVAAVSIFMPISIHLAKHYRFSPSKILLPLSYASIFGGTCTLIGTSTNLIVSSLAADAGFREFGMFELLPVGLVLFVVGMAYTLLVVQPRMPVRSQPESLTSKYALSSFLTELKIPESSSLIGTTVIDEQVSERFQITVLEILRGKHRITTDLRATPLEPGDLLIVRGTMEDILIFKNSYSLLLISDLKLSDSDLSDERNILAEVQLSPTSRLTDQSLKAIDFRRRFGCFVLALNRTGEVIREKLASIPLRQWDTLLVFGPRTRVEALYQMEDFVSLQEIPLRLHLARRWWLATVIVPVVVLLATFGVLSILEASILGAVAVLVTRCLTMQEAYEAINWTVIFLVATILPLGKAMENTGLATLIASWIVPLGVSWGPVATLAIIYIVTSVLTEIMSNNSTAVLMVPIAVAVAGELGLSAAPFLFAVTFAGSAAFLTPMGYKTNAMVFGPGGYKFTDFLAAGAPLKIVFWVLTVILIPLVWPFSP